MANSLQNRLSRKVWNAIENTPENLAVWKWNNNFYTTVGHFVSQILEESTNWTYVINIWTNKVELFSSFKEIMESLELEKEQLEENINNWTIYIVESMLCDIFKAKVVDKLEEKKVLLYQNHEESFKNFIKNVLEHKSTLPALVEAELQEITYYLGKLQRSQIENENNISDYLKYQNLKDKRYALENGWFYIKASELVEKLEAVSNLPWFSEQCLFVDKKTYKEFIEILLFEWGISKEELEDTILSNEQLEDIVSIYSSFMMQSFHNKINNEKERFVWNIMSLLQVTPKLYYNISQRFFQIPKWH